MSEHAEDHEPDDDARHLPPPPDDPAEDQSGGALYPLPTMLESITPTQVAASVHAHLRDLWGLSYDKEKRKPMLDLDHMLNIASTVFLMAYDDRRLSSAMANAARTNELFDSFSAVRSQALEAQS